jgi:hypothetical protein
MWTNLVDEPISSVGGGAVGETRVEVDHLAGNSQIDVTGE